MKEELAIILNGFEKWGGTQLDDENCFIFYTPHKARACMNELELTTLQFYELVQMQDVVYVKRKAS